MRYLLAVIFVIAMSLQAAAFPCAPRTQALETLKNDGKKPIAHALSEDGKAMMEVLAAPDGRWSLLVTDTSMTSCLMMSGGAWEILPPPAQGTAVRQDAVQEKTAGA